MDLVRRFLVLAVLALFGPAAHAADLNWSVYDKKTDKKLLDIRGKDIDNADGKKILHFDGKRLENAAGVAVLAFDKDTTSGFSIRNPKDTAVRLLWSNGYQLCKKVQEGVVFHYDGRNRTIAADATGPAIYTLTCHNGNLDSRLAPWQVVAIAYALQPTLFELSDAEKKAQRDAAAATEKEEDARVANRLKGDFTIINSGVKDLRKGKAAAKPVGKYFQMSYALDSGKKLQGIGLFFPSSAQDEEEVFTAMSANGAVALGVYEIADGELNGTWYPTALLADGKIAPGVEKLKGKTGDDLSGRFIITEAKAPGKGDPYEGTLDVKKFKRTDVSGLPSYQMTWTLGTVKVNGVGVVVNHFGPNSKRKKYLVVAAGSGDVLVGQHWHPSSSGVQLDFAVLGKSIAGNENAGTVYLTK